MFKPVICLMGPTASGKTPLAIQIRQQFPCEIISVDSTLVYRGMNIGTAKPTPDQLEKAPHHLIDFLDPKEVYSAGDFYKEAIALIDRTHQMQKIPVLVGGAMLYYRVLQQGIASLPKANDPLRQQLRLKMEQEGIASLHAELARVDALAASRIAINDSQRIQRALEVFLLTGRPISEWQKTTPRNENYTFYNFILTPGDRKQLHARIELRFQQMLENGFIKEVETLYQRGDLHINLPSIRSVGYRQVWAYLGGEITYEQMVESALAATRQLAKRQLTWLNRWPNGNFFHHQDDVLNAIKRVG